jgi:hypothetical protein
MMRVLWVYSSEQAQSRIICEHAGGTASHTGTARYHQAFDHIFHLAEEVTLEVRR